MHVNITFVMNRTECFNVDVNQKSKQKLTHNALLMTDSRNIFNFKCKVNFRQDLQAMLAPFKINVE